jgi:hypothetical protein
MFLTVDSFQFYGGRGDRKWTLKTLEADEKNEGANAKDQGELEKDYEEFMQEIEGDKEMRANIRMYKKDDAVSIAAAAANRKKKDENDKAAVKMSGESDDEDDEEQDEEEVRLDELLDELTLSSGLKGSDIEEASAKIVSADEAAQVPALNIEGSGFDAANFDANEFKFL